MFKVFERFIDNSFKGVITLHLTSGVSRDFYFPDNKILEYNQTYIKIEKSKQIHYIKFDCIEEIIVQEKL